MINLVYKRLCKKWTAAFRQGFQRILEGLAYVVSESCHHDVYVGGKTD